MNGNATLVQWLKFVFVGGLGVAVNAVVFAVFSQFSWGQIVPFDFLSEITVAWMLGILISMISNFLLDRYWVFKKEE